MRRRTRDRWRTIVKTLAWRFVGGCVVLAAIIVLYLAIDAQTVPEHPVPQTHLKYLDPTAGKTADEMVAYALENNLEIAAMRSEAAAARQLLRQAKLRPNPSLELSGTRQMRGMDRSLMVEGSLPLELGGRRGARVRMAEAEIEIRSNALAERERLLAAEVRIKFGESIAAALKLKFAEEMLAETEHHVAIVTETVTEGRRPPLEQSQETVELNRLRAMRETAEGVIEVKMFELRNLAGMTPEQPLRIRGDFESLLDRLPSSDGAAERAIQSRPDILGARAVEQLAAARVDQARAEGRIDADVMLGYQRMKAGFPQMGFDEVGMLVPIEMRSNIFTFGVRLNLPVRNRNQGMVAAAVLEEEAARRRREFGELTIRREVAAGFAKYNRAARAMQIYKTGVRDAAAANLDVVRQTYELGSKTLLDYIAEHHRFIENENGYIDAALEAYTARVEVLRALNAPELKNE